MSRFLSYSFLKKKKNQRNNNQLALTLQHYSCKLNDFTSASWRKHRYNAICASFHAKRVVTLLKSLWNPFKIQPKFTINCVPTRRPHFTLSRGVLVRKKQSRCTFNMRAAGWHINVKNTKHVFMCLNKQQLNASNLWFYKRATLLNKLDSLLDSSATPMHVSRFAVSTSLLFYFRVLRCFVFIRTFGYFI